MGLFFSINFKHSIITIVHYINLFTFSYKHRTHVPMHNHNHNQYTNHENIVSQLHWRYIQNKTY